MADWLRRSLAPLSSAAWKEIDETAIRVLQSQLSARQVVDFEGPLGFDASAVNLGRLELAKSTKNGVGWGTRRVLPLIEFRIPFTLDQMELDSISRGCSDPNLDAVADAAHKLASFEESAIFNGFAEAHINGMIPASNHTAIKLQGADRLTESAGAGVKALSDAGIGGPYDLVLSNDLYYELMQIGKGGYPPRRIIRDLLGGNILWSPAISGGVVLSRRGGDFKMTVGQDISIGYASHDRNTVELYLTESFTFRVLEPAACIALAPSKSKA